MASNENNGIISTVNFGGKNFNLYKFKLETTLSSKDHWKIVKGSELSHIPP